MVKQEQKETPRISLAEQANNTGAAIYAFITRLQMPRDNPAFPPYSITLTRFAPNLYARRFGINEFDKGDSLDNFGGVRVEIGGAQMAEGMEITFYEKRDHTPAVIEVSQDVGEKKRKKYLIWDPKSQLWTPEMNGHRPDEKPRDASELFERAVEIAKDIEEFLV